MKYLQVRLEEGLWKRIALRALDGGVRMSELVRGVLLKEFGGPGYGVKPEPERLPPGIPVEESAPITKTCVKCKSKVQKWIWTKDGKTLCQDCAADLIVSNA